jgi:glyoxylase-like metal-dependent hydrolase (beta-lactamase superfamily II)
MHIKAITTGAFEEICYIAWGDANQAIIIDPGHDAGQILQAVEQHRLEVAAYACTHGHADHINALAELHKRHPAPVAMHSNDLVWALEPVNRIEPYYPVPTRPDVETFQRLESAANWNFADLSFRCMETPGHTPGSCCILFEEDGILVSGDTLFKGSCGRTDLPGGNPRRMKESLGTLRPLPDETRVYPGHGPDTTIGIERATNFFMQ